MFAKDNSRLFLMLLHDQAPQGTRIALQGISS